ncbi:MAG: hypothetical protein ACFFAU_04730 [Candidatus Hodarchaeota archaeon]
MKSLISDKTKALMRLVDIFLFSAVITPIIIFWSTKKVIMAEDAFIAFRYVKNLASGLGYVWNPGGDEVFGSTSFLWTILLAFILKFSSIDILSLTLALNFVLLVLTSITIYLTIKKILNLHQSYALFSVALFSLSRAYILAKLGFDCIFFTTILTVQFSLLVLMVSKNKQKILYQIAFLTANLLLVLARPEGIMISLFSLMIVIILNSDLRVKNFAILSSFVLIIPIILFHILQISYFGYLFPNTLYVKLTSLDSVFNTLFSPWGTVWVYKDFLFSGIPLIIVVTIGIWLVLQKTETFLHEVLLLLPTGLYLIGYLFIVPMQNVEHRFQFVIVPILLITFVKALNYLISENISTKIRECIFIFHKMEKKGIRTYIPLIQTIWLILVIAGMFFASYSEAINFDNEGLIDERSSFGKALSPFAHLGYKIAVTEAGQIPFHSNWISLDVIGLNDEHIAHKGFNITYIEEFDPDLIQFHAYSSNFTSQWSSNAFWNKTVSILIEYCLEKNFTLVIITKPDLRIMGGYEWIFMKNKLEYAFEIATALTNLKEINYHFKVNITELQ